VLPLTAVAFAVALALPRGAIAHDACPTPGVWIAVSDSGRSVRPDDIVSAGLAQRRVVLLGESHGDAEHHRWQLHTIAALHARQPRLALGFEMFPRRAQPVLDRWSAGELSEEQFLTRGDWANVWGHDPQLYMPIFHFARMHRIPMIALNVERSLVRRVGAEGWDAVPPAEREGVGEPAVAPAPYVSFLYESYLAHLPESQRPRRAPSDEDLRSPQFRRFVQSMQVWDRAMAEAIVERLRADRTPLVVAIMGAGHLRNGHGVPHQLRDLGIPEPAVLLPWYVGQDCALLTAGVADLVFGVEDRRPEAPERPRLGVTLDQSEHGVTIRDVLKGSIAESAGARAGDVIKTVAGVPVKDAGTVIAAVQRQAPGTWLPITVQRGTQSLELVARFPGKP